MIKNMIPKYENNKTGTLKYLEVWDATEECLTFVGLRMAQHATPMMGMNANKKDGDGEMMMF